MTPAWLQSLLVTLLLVLLAGVIIVVVGTGHAIWLAEITAFFLLWGVIHLLMIDDHSGKP